MVGKTSRGLRGLRGLGRENRRLFLLHPRNPRNPRPILVPLCKAPPQLRSVASPRSDVQQETYRIFDQVFDMMQKSYGLPAIDDAMVVRKGDVHHGTRENRPLADDGALGDGMQAENAALRGIDDRCREQ